MSFNMSTGAKYFTEKYSLARSHIEGYQSNACICDAKDYEKIMACPHKHKEATKSARNELMDVKSVTKRELNNVQRHLEFRKQQLLGIPPAAIAVEHRNNSTPQQAELHHNNTNAAITEEQKTTNGQQAEFQNNDSNKMAAQNSTPQMPGLDHKAVAAPANVYAPGPAPPCPGLGHHHRYPPGLGSRITLKFKGKKRTLNEVNGLPTGPSNDVQMSDNISPVDNPVPVITNPKQSLKRKNDNLFDLESIAKRTHHGYCDPPPVHPISRPFLADNYNYLNEKSPPTPVDNSTPEPEEPAEPKAGQPPVQIRTAGAMTRRQTANGAKLVKPVGDNYAPQGGLTRPRGKAKTIGPEPAPKKTPADKKKKKMPMYGQCGGITSIKDGLTERSKADMKKEFDSDMALIAARKANAAKFKAEREQLYAHARQNESMEYPDTSTYDRMVAKRNTKLDKDANENETQNVESDPLSRLLKIKNKAIKISERLHTAVSDEFNKNGASEEHTRLNQAATAADLHLQGYRQAWRDAFDPVKFKEKHLEAMREALRPVPPAATKTPLTFTELSKIQQERDDRETHLDNLITKYRAKEDAVEQARARNDKEAWKEATIEADNAEKIFDRSEKQHQEWFEANNDALNAAPTTSTEAEDVVFKDGKTQTPYTVQKSTSRTRIVPNAGRFTQAPVFRPKNSTPEKKTGSKTYKIASQCANLAKDILENKEKITAAVREVKSIEKIHGPLLGPLNKPVLSAVPARLRMLKPSFQMTTLAPKRIQTPRKPSNLRYELGACLQEEAASEAAQLQAEIDEQQREEAELEIRRERTRRIRAVMTEQRRNHAIGLAKDTVRTGIRPPKFHDDILKKEYHLALKQYLNSDEGMRANARRLAMELAGKNQPRPIFRSQREEDFFDEALEYWLNLSGLSMAENESEEVVQDNQDQMEGIEGQAEAEQDQTGNERQANQAEMEGVEPQDQDIKVDRIERDGMEGVELQDRVRGYRHLRYDPRQNTYLNDRARDYQSFRFDPLSNTYTRE